MPDMHEQGLVKVASLTELAEKGRRVVKVGAKQIALFHHEGRVHACNNRCPHEGFPLSEGTLTGGCILTCNWHNWKFDLEGGETLVGGDTLRRYPVTIDGDDILLDVTDPPAAERAQTALDNLRRSFDRNDYRRMAREIARLRRADADPLDAVRGAVAWTHDRLEYGTTHAHAAAPDWLAIGETRADGDGQALVPVLEIVGNLADDTLREPEYPYPLDIRAYDPEALVAAIEAEDEAAAVGLVRGALTEGLDPAELERPLAHAALAHYQDFGHALIFVLKTFELIARLGPESAEPLLLAMTRSLVYARREDLIPEFRAYGPALERWDGKGDAPVAAEDLTRLSVVRAMDRVLQSSADIPALYDALMGAAAWQFLHFDLDRQSRTEQSIAQNVSWLDFTHGITFGNAVREICTRYPELWPRGLLQMACFLGRNTAFTDPEYDASAWEVADADAFFATWFPRLFDHGETEFIVSCHLVKLLTAVQGEVLAAPEAPWVPDLLGSTRRFLESPLKMKHTLRTVRQALDFTAVEG